MRAVYLDKNEVRFLSDYQTDEIKNQIPVRVTLAGVCETDLQLIKGYMGFRGVLGHEFVGVAEAGKFAGRRVVGEINCACGSCEACQSGLENHCPHRSVVGILNHDGAFADTVFVPEVNLHPVPDTLPDEVAVFTEPLAAAFQIPAQVNLAEFEKAVVIGDGRLAYLIAQVLRSHKLDVLVIGKHHEKLARFEKQSIDTGLLDQHLARREFDLAVDCSGSSSGMETAFCYLRPRGTLVLKTTIAGASEVNLAPIVIDEITVVGSRCGPFDVALQALENREIEVESLVTARFPLEKAVEALAIAAQKSQGKVLLELA